MTLLTQTRIFLAEDEPIIASIIQEFLESQGFQVTVCHDGVEAWNCLQEEGGQFDAILLDRGLPNLDGMEVLRRIKNDSILKRIPVIIETSHGDKESIREGLNKGAHYYLTKPFQPEVLMAVVNSALLQSRELTQMVDNLRRSERPLALLHDGVYRFRELEEARILANYLARACPDPERAIQGLLELMVNAVEHGNLGITYVEKGVLILEGKWQDEIQCRLNMPEYRERYVEVHFQRFDDKICFSIQDQGAGFDWQEFLDFSTERAFDLHGRGIAIAHKLSFDYLAYEGNGNRVVVQYQKNRKPDQSEIE